MGVKKPVFDHPSLKIGERVYSDLQPGQRMPILNWVVAVTTLALYCGWVNLLIMLGVAAIWLVWPRYVLVLLWSTLLLPAKPVLWTAFCKLWVFKTWRQYFRYSYFFEEKLDPTKRYVLYEAPHGTFPIGPIVAGTLCQTFFPDAPIYSVAANSVFNIPLWRHFISWIGSLPASKSNFKRLLDHGSVAVVVGGIAEMYMCNPKKERIKMLGRKGFVRIALEEQVDGIVPVYYFGNSQAFNFGPAFLEGVSRKWRTSLGVLYGVCGLPIPHPVQMYLVHGKPIPVPKVAKDDPEFERHVTELLDIAVKGMQDLYENHRKEYGWPEKPLSIE
ncbi:diacylglycerol acyltransferase [Haematococcus lacustris]|uniref:Acyltransferase n=1 Tax=Haematococcus lacustris TaxID=44745 RepID=A0A873A8Y9_HAELA|nr:DGTT3 [Haematococcus lacustris]